MALKLEDTVEIIEVMENWMERIRPPLHIRSQLDIGYKIDNQNIIVFEIRPSFDNSDLIRELPYARAAYVKAENAWKIYWMRGNLKWSAYEPKPVAKSLKAFTRVVDEDEYHCFKG